MSFWDSTLGKILSVAAPVIGGAFGGPIGAAAGGALGSAAQGGSFGQDALFGGLSGLGAGLMGAGPSGGTGIGLVDSMNGGINSALSPISSGLSGLLGGTPASASSGGASAAPAATSSALGDSASLNAPTNASGYFNITPQSAGMQSYGLQTDPSLGGLASSAGGQAAANAAAPSSIMGNLLSKAANNPMQALAIASLILQNGQSPRGTQSQAQILAQMKAQQAQQQAQAAKVVSGLNSASLNRTQTNPSLSNADYYTYGSRPQPMFFNNQSTPLSFAQTFAKGGYVKGGALSGGQDDDVDAKLSNGEFVIPADVVSGLGDGANEAGAAKLHGLMDNVRKHKTGSTKYPPKAKSVDKYLGKKFAKGGSSGSYSASNPQKQIHYQVYGRV